MRNPGRLSIPSPLTINVSRPISPGPSSVDALLSQYQTRRPRSRSVVSLDRSMEQPGLSSEDSVFSDTSLWSSDSFQRIELGTFIAFRLDRETLAGRLPPDSEKYNEIQSMHFGTYLGLVTRYWPPSPDAEEPLEEYEVHYVSTTPPQERGAEGNFVPIAPAMWDSDYRQPLQTTPFFPFMDLVVWTTFGTRIKVKTYHYSPLGFQLPANGEELIRFFGHSDDDFDELRDCVPDSANPFWRQRAGFPQDAIAAEVYRDIRIAEPRGDPERFAIESQFVDRRICGEEDPDNQEDEEVIDLLAESDSEEDYAMEE